MWISPQFGRCPSTKDSFSTSAPEGGASAGASSPSPESPSVSGFGGASMISTDWFRVHSASGKTPMDEMTLKSWGRSKGMGGRPHIITAGFNRKSLSMLLSQDIGKEMNFRAGVFLGQIGFCLLNFQVQWKFEIGFKSHGFEIRP